VVPLDNPGPLRFDVAGALLTISRAGVVRWPFHADAAAPARRHVGPPQILARMNGADNFVGVSPDGNVLALPQFNQCTVVLRRDRTGEPLQLAPQDDVRCCAVSPEDRWVATGSHSSQGVFAKVWDARTGQHVKDLPVHGNCWWVGFSADGRWLATTGGGVRLWAVGSWEEGPRVGGEACAFSADGKLLAV